MIPKNLKYSKTHEWINVEGEIATVGITDYAQSELSDMVFLELPKVGTRVQKDNSMGTIEAVKAVSDLYAPLSGEILEVNSDLERSPDLVNKDCYGKGWMVKIKLSDLSELDSLISAEEYEELIGKEKH